MSPARTFVVLGLLFLASTGNAGSTPARTPVPIPVTVAELAAAAESDNPHRSLLLLDIVRTFFDAPEKSAGGPPAAHARVLGLLRSAPASSPAMVPLPLPPAVWREAIFQRQIPDGELIAAIFSSRKTALLYFGLSALDDETLTFLATDRAALAEVLKHPGAFAAFGRSLHVRGDRVLVPGGPAAAQAWKEVVGADPGRPSSFVRALFGSDRARIAFLYDTVAHLDAPRQRFALAALGGLADVFRDFAGEWDVEIRPLARPPLDPALLFMTISVGADGTVAGPSGRSIWERVFRDDGAFDVGFSEVREWTSAAPDVPVDAAWLAARVHLPPHAVGRRRLETFLFAQRVLRDTSAGPHVVASVLRAFRSMPALMLALERAGVRDAPTLLAAARQAWAATGRGEDGAASISAFQCAVALVERGVRSRALSPSAAQTLVGSLIALPLERGFVDPVAGWIRTELFRAAPQPPVEATDPVEEAVLALLAGARERRQAPVVEWEGAAYRVDPAAAEMSRLRRVRQRQGGRSLDAAITRLLGTDRRKAREREEARREFLASIVSLVYAPHMGDPDGPALAAENVALRHDLGLSSAGPGATTLGAWRLPVEQFGRSSGWLVRGSLVGLESALRGLSLRRLDPGLLPAGSKMPMLERQAAMLTAALMNPHAISDDERDRVAAAISAGRARIEALRRDPALADDVASEAGLSEWRREALKWALAHAPEDTAGAFSLVETFWLGGGGAELDGWGAASLPLTGCLCLVMPRPTAWENLAGRPAAGLLATTGVDVALRLAQALAARRLPAALMPALVAYAMQDVLDAARPAYLDDWPAFWRAAAAIPDETIDDYLSALTAEGPLIPASHGTS